MKPTELNTKSDLQPVDNQRNQEDGNLKIKSGTSLPSTPKLEPLILKSSYRIKDLAKMFGVSNGTINRWREKGLLNGYKPGGRPGCHWLYVTSRNEDFFRNTFGKSGREIIILPALW